MSLDIKQLQPWATNIPMSTLVCRSVLLENVDAAPRLASRPGFCDQEKAKNACPVYGFCMHGFLLAELTLSTRINSFRLLLKHFKICRANPGQRIRLCWPVEADAWIHDCNK